MKTLRWLEDIFKNCKNWTLLLLLLLLLLSSSLFPLCMIFTIIYTKTNHVSTQYSVAAILQSLFMAHTTLFAMLNLLYFCTSTFRSMCAVPSTAVFCSSLISCFPCIIIIIIRRCNDRYCSRSAQLQGYTATSRDETELFAGKTTQRNYRVSCVVIQNTSTLLLRQSATVHAKCNNTQSAVATGRQANCNDMGTTRRYFGAQF